MKRLQNILPALLIATIHFLSPGRSSGQGGDSRTTAINISQDSAVAAWLEDLYAEAVTVGEDSIVVSPEAKRLLVDEVYRGLMYPKIYSWEVTVELIKRLELKKAFWYMVNLYMADARNKDIVVKSLMTYDRLFKMEKVLVNSFYTYVLADPEIGTLTGGEFKVTAPHIMEKKLNALKEILFYLDKYRTKEEAGK
jgi:hypothetical protein